MCGSMLVFRGALLPSNAISQFAVQHGKKWDFQDVHKYKKIFNNKVNYKENAPGYIHLPGVTSTSSSFKVALQFAKANKDAS
jgi:hypothetical protein